MKPAPAPDVPGNTPWEKLDNAVRKIFTVPKSAIKVDAPKRPTRKPKP
jgi:hypothetical protein